MKKILRILFSRIFYVGVAILLQIGWILAVAFLLSGISDFVGNFISLVSLCLVLWIVNKNINPSYKLAWTILILAVPFLGTILYLLYGKSRVAKKMEESFEKVLCNVSDDLREDPQVRYELNLMDKRISHQSVYIRDYSQYPVYKNTTTEYFSIGEDMFANMVQEIEKAKHFIFLEYFIIAKGVMWDTLLTLLERKVKQGVEVRLIYDDMGCITTLPNRFYKELQKKGIKCASFNPFRPVLNVILNNRDHRKILIIDGYTCFTGGINIADEYINVIERFGHWKDGGIRIQGEAVWNFTIMFLQMWKVITKVDDNYMLYSPYQYHKESFDSDGFVQPYSDTPLDNEVLGENVYLNMINQAVHYIYIFTPYLIIDNEMSTALCLAAKRGVDVRIITPGIPDKKTVFLLTQSYYEILLKGGVKIYEYFPGFVHSKCFVCDDELACVGTINLDYRSLYLHFECGVWLYKTKAVMQVKEDILETLYSCKPISIEFCRNRNIVVRGIQSIMRLLAPMF